jgi:hypothetical protein
MCGVADPQRASWAFEICAGRAPLSIFSWLELNVTSQIQWLTSAPIQLILNFLSSLEIHPNDEREKKDIWDPGKEFRSFARGLSTSSPSGTAARMFNITENRIINRSY